MLVYNFCLNIVNILTVLKTALTILGIAEEKNPDTIFALFVFDRNKPLTKLRQYV